MKIELTKKEAVLLAGLLGVTEGQGLARLYGDLLLALTMTDPEGKEIADLMTVEIDYLLKGKTIDEDIVYKDAKRWHKGE